jgi:radical SAM protein with 4Fe4S-binding SPASM domain
MRCRDDGLPGFEFDGAAIDEALKHGRLLSIEIEFSRRCNFRCSYCYVAGEHVCRDEMSGEEIRDVIVQARELGARKIVVLGGEPMIYPAIFEMLEFIGGRGLEVELFTNGSNVTAANARRLQQLGVNVALKMNSFDKEIQDRLTGVPGSCEIIQAALANLMSSGYPSERAFLAISSIICRQNISEMTKLWRWLRDRGLLPYHEMLTPQGNAADNQWLYPDPREMQELFEEIARIDGEEYGRSWDPQPPLAGNACLRHSFSCLVSANGDVMPCVGVALAVGNVREKSLKSIIGESQVIRDLRNHRRTITGPCATCEKAGACYGCRGAAYQLTGDYLASDPTCWRNAGGVTARPAGASEHRFSRDPSAPGGPDEQAGSRRGEAR